MKARPFGPRAFHAEGTVVRVLMPPSNAWWAAAEVSVGAAPTRSPSRALTPHGHYGAPSDDGSALALPPAVSELERHALAPSTEVRRTLWPGWPRPTG